MPPTYCARCGCRLSRSDRLKSKHTGFFYCIDLVACDKRAADTLSLDEIQMYTEKLAADLDDL